VEITVDKCPAVHDRTEPKSSPDGDRVAFVTRWGTACSRHTSGGRRRPHAISTIVSVQGGDIELVVDEGEGHCFRDPDHQRDEYRRIGGILVSVVDGR
jgi:dipeptidyl aminopeptidase/acylaminoacyl peptidase